MAGSSEPCPIGACADTPRVHGGLLCKAAPAQPGLVTGRGLIPQISDDIRNRFVFREWRGRDYLYIRASGELGVPGAVSTHRDQRAQRQVSSGSGEHAGHLIGIQFGAPGDGRNLGLQNANMNTFAPKKYQEAFTGPGGSYHNLESTWRELLIDGWRIDVVVTDKYRTNEDRPFTRNVCWTAIATWGERDGGTLDFGNFDSPQKRAAEA